MDCRLNLTKVEGIKPHGDGRFRSDQTSSDPEVVGDLLVSIKRGGTSRWDSAPHTRHRKICSKSVSARTVVHDFAIQESYPHRGIPRQAYNAAITLGYLGKSSDFSELSGAQSRNRTSDTRIFKIWLDGNALIKIVN
jgi:hypothetical protein